MLMVRDNQSERGTFKKAKTLRMSLNSNTLYQFDLAEEDPNDMVFFLGGNYNQKCSFWSIS
jgi:hypothetical protein